MSKALFSYMFAALKKILVVKKIYLFVMFTVVLFLSCSSEDDGSAVQSSEKDILSFEISEIRTEIDDDKILIYIPPSRTEGLIFETIIKISPKSRIDPSSNFQDFSQSRIYTVTAEDGSTKRYTTELVFEKGIRVVNIAYTSQLQNGDIAKGKLAGSIDEKNNIIEFRISKEFLLSEKVLAQFDVILEGESTIVPAQDTFIDLTLSKVTLTIDGVDKVYTVKFVNIGTQFGLLFLDLMGEKIGDSPSNQAPESETIGLDFERRDLVYYVLETEDVSSIKVTLQSPLPIGATITPSIDEPIDFTNDVLFTVTAESGDIREFMVRVIKKKIYFQSEILGGGHIVGTIGDWARYHAISKIKKVSIINEDLNKEIPCTITSNEFTSNAESIFYFDFDQPVNNAEEYVYKVELENGEVIISNYRIVVSVP